MKSYFALKILIMGLTLIASNKIWVYQSISITVLAMKIL
jgi:hypothetical protein